MTGSSAVHDLGGVARLNRVVRFYRMVLRISLSIMLFLFVRSLVAQLPRPHIEVLATYVLFKATLVAYMYC